MSDTLTIKAIPTLYRGRQYRSQLEAKWAAFFDLLGWKHEYEPFTLPGWLPDFEITGPNGTIILVEVKPIKRFSKTVGEKMINALEGEIEPYLLLVGTRPISVGSGGGEVTQLGWMSIDSDDILRFDPVILGWSQEPDKPEFTADIWTLDHSTPTDPWVNGTFVEFYGYSSARKNAAYASHNDLLWAEACNRVQWRGVRSEP